jgi:hypothetical protein
LDEFSDSSLAGAMQTGTPNGTFRYVSSLALHLFKQKRSGFESLYTSRYGGSLSVRLQSMQSGASCSHCSHDRGSRCRTNRELWRTQEWTGRKKKRTKTTFFSLKVSRHPVVPGAYAIPHGPWRVRASMGLSAAL